MKWLIGIAVVMLLVHFFWKRAEKIERLLDEKKPGKKSLPED